MALVIEDGSLVAGANSYVDVATVRAYAGARTVTIPATGGPGDAEIEAAIIKGMDYLESLRREFQGAKVDASQALQWPREGVWIDGFEVAITAIPTELKSALCELAINSTAGTDLQPAGDGREIIREKVDVLETEYAAGSGGAPQPVLTKARTFLAPLLMQGLGFGLRVKRA